ncbi:DUF3299 domain-containing protein [Endozoicomonas sp. SCSIO W0465]|uniref:DUF3299 domain-containing protein n=1 Tax=Endozoicomonas sp. SCSIO W0465 TaxID=2918516 RepID=UPI002074D78C|nr:DUF3299 domain-containing protein [Endozoicomonas sp. SCSIO W0465]USE38798.1 DUF3299 domain-containing protein [Endozoicomonas sp. SCSIO W0465]
MARVLMVPFMLIVMSMVMSMVMPTNVAMAAVESTETPPIKEINWDDLMPPVDEEIVRKYEAGEISQLEAIDYIVELGKIPVESMDQQRVKIPGYLVPLNIGKDQSATELLLVPTLGACIHVPPPPPNQTIFVRYDQGITVTEAGYTPYWLEGVIRVENHTSEYTDVVYAITVESIKAFE